MSALQRSSEECDRPSCRIRIAAPAGLAIRRPPGPRCRKADGAPPCWNTISRSETVVMWIMTRRKTVRTKEKNVKEVELRGLLRSKLWPPEYGMGEVCCKNTGEHVCLLVQAMAVIRLRWKDSREQPQTKHGSRVLMEKNASPLI